MITEVRSRIAVLRSRLERLLLWRVWERMLEIEFVDRSIALAGKAFVSFFPLVIVVAAFVPEHIRSSILTSVTARLGLRGDALVLAREGVASGLWWFTAWFLLLGEVRARCSCLLGDHQHRDGRVRGIRHSLDARGSDGQ